MAQVLQSGQHGIGGILPDDLRSSRCRHLGRHDRRRRLVGRRRHCPCGLPLLLRHGWLPSCRFGSRRSRTLRGLRLFARLLQVLPRFAQFIPGRRRCGRGSRLRKRRWHALSRLFAPSGFAPALLLGIRWHLALRRVALLLQVLPQPFYEADDDRHDNDRHLNGIKVSSHQQGVHGGREHHAVFTSSKANLRRSWCACRCRRARFCIWQSP